MGNQQNQIIKDGLSLHKSGQYEEAIQKYNQVIEVNPNNPDLYSNKATSLYQLGRYEEAIQVYNQALYHSPNNSLIYYFKGLCYYELKLYDDVVQFCEQAIFMNQAIACIAEVYNLRGLSFYQLGLFDEAISSFNDALNYDQTNKLFYLHKANTLRQQQKYEEALSVYNTGIQFHPHDLALVNSKAVCLMNMCYYEEALAIFNQAIIKWPQDFHILSNKGVTLFYLARFEEALETYDNALILQPNNYIIIDNKAFCLIKLCRNEEAELILTKILPKINDDLILMGKVLNKLGKYKEAKEIFEKALLVNPRDHQIICQIALTYAQLGEIENVQDIMKYDIKWETLSDNLQIQLAQVHQIVNDFDSAIKHFDIAISKNSKNSEYFYMKARYQYQFSQFKEALVSIEKSIELSGENQRFNYYNLKGKCEFQCFQPEKGIESYLKSLRISPWKFAETLSTLQELLNNNEKKKFMIQEIPQLLLQCQKFQPNNNSYQRYITNLLKLIDEIN